MKRWDMEPDFMSWLTGAGYPALIRRHLRGSLCGYVGMPRNHLWADEDATGSSSLGEPTEDPHYPVVHGGVSFDEKIVCINPGRETLDWIDVISMPEWYGQWRIIGFDCAHAFDYVPGLDDAMRSLRPGLATPLENTRYRDTSYVMEECEDLARWVASGVEGEIGKPRNPLRGWSIEMNTQPTNEYGIFRMVEARPAGTVCFGRTKCRTPEAIEALHAVESLRGMGYPVYYRIGEKQSHVFVARDAWDKWDTIMASRGGAR